MHPGHEGLGEVRLAPADDGRVQAVALRRERLALRLVARDLVGVVLERPHGEARRLGGRRVDADEVRGGPRHPRVAVVAPGARLALEQRQRVEARLAVARELLGGPRHRRRARGAVDDHRVGRERRVRVVPERLLGPGHRDDDRHEVLRVDLVRARHDVRREDLLERRERERRALAALGRARQRLELLRLVRVRRGQVLELVLDLAHGLPQRRDELGESAAVRVLGVLPDERRQVAVHGHRVDQQRLAVLGRHVRVLALDLADRLLDRHVDALHVVRERHERVERADRQRRHLDEVALGAAVRVRAQPLERLLGRPALVRHRHEPERVTHGLTRALVAASSGLLGGAGELTTGWLCGARAVPAARVGLAWRATYLAAASRLCWPRTRAAFAVRARPAPAKAEAGRERRTR
mmetsp:Transcript_34779/g.107620  ORF Transcript_34779/g.107620 Transcript_34779/m.107620 type:complete len:410 (-) Transcript_34779:216-1445(-)